MKKIGMFLTVLCVLFFAFSALPSFCEETGGQETPSDNPEDHEYNQERLPCSYDVAIEQKEGESFEEATKRAREDFDETLAEVCERWSVDHSVPIESGPHQVNYRQVLTYDLSLYGEPDNIEGANDELEREYGSSPDTP